MSGVFPPGKTSPALCGLVLRNLLETHVAAYQRLQSLMEQPRDAHVRIGIVHCVYHFDCWNPLNGFDWYEPARERPGPSDCGRRDGQW